jgi:gluconokinase
MRTQTQPIEILRAAMEAVAYRFALIARQLEALQPNVSIICSGNAVRSSKVWGQILADVLGQPLTLSGTCEASTHGAALLALEAAGKIQSIEEIPVAVERIIEPEMSRHQRYREGLERQEHFYHQLIQPR